MWKTTTCRKQQRRYIAPKNRQHVLRYFRWNARLCLGATSLILPIPTGLKLSAQDREARAILGKSAKGIQPWKGWTRLHKDFIFNPFQGCGIDTRPPRVIPPRVGPTHGLGDSIPSGLKEESFGNLINSPVLFHRKQRGTQHNQQHTGNIPWLFWIGQKPIETEWIY